MGDDVTLRALQLHFPKMTLFGLTDLPAAHQTEECPKCHSALRVSSGLCLRCLLQAGLAEDNDEWCRESTEGERTT